MNWYKQKLNKELIEVASTFLIKGIKKKFNSYFSDIS